MLWLNGCWDTRRIVRVTGVTETLIKVDGYRFRKSDGAEPGTNRPDHIQVPSDKDREELAMDQETNELKKFIRTIDWRSQDLQTLRAVRKLFPA